MMHSANGGSFMPQPPYHFHPQSHQKERRISNLATFDIKTHNNMHSSTPDSRSEQEHHQSDSGGGGDYMEQSTIKSSARVLQLKREIEDLDARLMQTNTVNFDEMRTSMLREAINHSSDIRDNLSHHYRSRAALQLEEMRHSVGNSSLKKQEAVHPSMDERSSVKIYQQIQSNANQLNTSHFTQDDVSFDLEKIQATRSLNLKTAFETNLKQKRDTIQDLRHLIGNLMKEQEVKNMKLSHLRFERENIINQIQIEAIKKKEQAKDAREQVKRIEVKKNEDERAYSIAQSEIKRNIADQQYIIDQILSNIDHLEVQLEDMLGKNSLLQSSNSKSNSNQHLNEKINQQETKLQQLNQKKDDINKNLGILKNFLKTISEEIQMTQEDLSGKLLQRAEFVAQREELDQMYDSGRMAFGKCFELYLKINEDNSMQSGSQSSRFLSKEYENEKSLAFISSLLQQIKQSSKSKHYESIDETYRQIENMALTNLDIDKSLTWICNLSLQLGLNLDKQVLMRHLTQSHLDKDTLYSQRHHQLKEIISEIRRFERLIKENANLVDNMILPQLKAMSTTYNEHKNKYRKLKQAGFVIRERIKKGEREMQAMLEDHDKQAINYTQVRHIEGQLGSEKDRFQAQRFEMDKLIENKEQIDKEYRRAQQSLALKEREMLYKIDNVSNVPVSQSVTSLNATQISMLSNQRQQEADEERMKKRFSDIEDKIRDALAQKEEVDQKIEECKQALQETQESCEHAKYVVLNSQRGFHSQNGQYKRKDKQYQTQQNTQLGNNDECQITSFTDHDQLPEQFPSGPQKLTLSNLKTSARHRQTNTAIVVNIQEPYLLQDGKKSHYKDEHKENNMFVSKSHAGSKFKNSKESLTKLDLSKIMQFKDSHQPSTYSGQRSASNLNNYEVINYDKRMQESTTLADISASSIHHQKQSQKYKRQSKQQQQSSSNNYLSQNTSDLNMFNGEDIIVQTTNANNNLSTSIMNLSDLIIHSNPAIQNIMQIANQQMAEKALTASRQTFSCNTSQQPPMRQSQSSLAVSQIKHRVEQHHNQNLSDVTMDQSLLLQFDDMVSYPNKRGPAMHRGGNGVRRTSVETADFLHDERHKNHQPTIDVDLSHRMQLDQQHHHQIPLMPVSPDIQSTKNRVFFNRIAQPHITQSVNFNTYSSEHLLQGKHRHNSKNAWMSKYLNSGNEFSRMNGVGLQQSVSPDSSHRRGPQVQQNQWNRALSQERYRIPNQHLNVSSNSNISISNYNDQSYHQQQQQLQHAQGERLSKSRSASRLTKQARKLNKSMNGGESTALLQQSISSSQMLNPITMSVNFAAHNISKQSHHYANHFNNGPECIQFSKIDVSFAERIVPLLDGAAFYKKFSSRQSLNEHAFDPLNSDKFPPESCGYGIRLFQLDKSLMCINVRMSLKIAVETTIPLNDIVKPILPQTTMDIIRAQKQFHYYSNNHTSNTRKNSRNGLVSQSMCGLNGGAKDLLEEFLILESKGSISHLAKIGIVNKNSELYRQKCLESQFYPFSIALTNGRVELIATSYETLKNWIIGINLLVSYKKHIPKLKQLMELKLD